MSGEWLMQMLPLIWQNNDVAFATAAGTDKEKIAKQFWIAMYNRGFE